MPAVIPVPGIKGKQIVKSGCLLPPGVRTLPTAVVVDPTATATKGANTIAITDLTASGTRIEVGQPLAFIRTDGQVVMAFVRTTYTGGTTLNVEPLTEDVPGTSAAAFPAPIYTRSTFNIAGTTDTTTLSSYEHINNEVAAGSSQTTFSADGYKNDHYDPGYWMFLRSYESKAEIGIRQESPPPSSAFTKGVVEEYAVLVTGINEDKPEAGFFQFNVSGIVQGNITRTRAVPV